MQMQGSIVRTVAFLGALTLASAASSAGDIYGSLRAEAGQLRNASVNVNIGGTIYTGPYDGRGFYRVRVNTTGRGTIWVVHSGGATSPIPAQSFSDPVRLNLVVDGRNLRSE